MGDRVARKTYSITLPTDEVPIARNVTIFGAWAAALAMKSAYRELVIRDGSRIVARVRDGVVERVA